MTAQLPGAGLGFLLAEDEALKIHLQGITVADEKNVARAVQVWFANPDVESRQQSYPYMTIELLDVNWASYRQHSGVIVDSDKQGTMEALTDSAYTYQTPTAWDMVYQITTYARHPRHDRAILSALMNDKFDAQRGFLKVYNQLGTEYGWRHLVLLDFIKRDMIEDGRRLFRNVFTVLVTSEGVRNDGTTAPFVEEVLVNNDPTYTPDDLQTP